MLGDLHGVADGVDEETLERIEPLVAGVADPLGAPLAEPRGHEAPPSGAVFAENPTAEAAVVPAAGEGGEGEGAVHAGGGGAVGEPVGRLGFEEVLVDAVVGLEEWRGAWYVDGGAEERDVGR